MENNQQEQSLIQVTQIRFIDLLKDKEKKDYENFSKTICCGSGIISQVIFLIISQE